MLQKLNVFQDSSTVTPVTLRVDPFGYFLYWTDQNEVTFMTVFVYFGSTWNVFVLLSLWECWFF